jgi:hypothetical protein
MNLSNSFGFGNGSSGGSGGSETWQQVLDNGSVLTKANTIDGGGYNFVLDNVLFGINKTTPTVALDVFGEVKTAGSSFFLNQGYGSGAFFQNGGTFNSTKIMTVNEGNDYLVFQLPYDAEGGLTDYGFGDLSTAHNGGKFFLNDAANKSYYDNTSHTGNFGINTSTPSVSLDVVGDAKIINSDPATVTLHAQSENASIQNVLVLGRTGYGDFFWVDKDGNLEANNIKSDGTIETSSSGSGAGLWQLGTLQSSAVVIDTTQYVEVKIDGVVLKLALAV